MKILSNDIIKKQCKNKIKCLTGTKKQCKCLFVGEMTDKTRDSSFVGLARKIEEIQDGIMELKKKGLNDRAVVVLLQDSTKLPKGQIRKILKAIENLSVIYHEGGKH